MPAAASRRGNRLLHPQTSDFYYAGPELDIVRQVKNDPLSMAGASGQSNRLVTSEADT
jgi:hypothetical protein